jgi:hypothetical protein
LKKIILFKIGSRNAQLPKLIGSILTIISVLMLVHSAAVLFDSGIAVKNFDKCVENSGARDLELLSEPAQILAELRFQECKNSFYQITGAQVPGGETSLTTRQMMTSFTGPTSIFFIWAIVFLFALFLFNNTSIVVPIEEKEINLKSKSVKKKSKKKKK